MSGMSDGGPRSFGSRPDDALDRGLERLYRRASSRYLEVLLGLTAAFVALAVVPGAAIILIPFYDATAAESLRMVAAFELGFVPGFVATFLIPLRRHAAALPWLRGERSTDAARATWESMVLRMPGTVALIVASYMLCCIAPALYVGAVLDLSAVAQLLYLSVIYLLALSVGVFMYLAHEHAWLPVIREAASLLPRDFVPTRSGVSLRTKLIVVLPTTNLFTGIVVAAVSTNSLGREASLAVSVAAALLVSVTLSMAFSLLVRRSVWVRLEEVRNAMARVQDRDYEVRIPSVAGDEFDDVAYSFNEMVGRLGRHEKDLRESRERIVTAADAARRRVERDLHDGAQQNLVLLRLKLGFAHKTVEHAPEKGVPLIEEAQQDLDRALAELRDLAHGIYPAVLESDGLPGALTEAVERAAIPAALECDGAKRYPPELEAAVYFCCLEALQNAAKHAGDGARAKVRLAQRNGSLEFEVADDGRGYDADATGPSAGVQNMADRIGALGGELRIASAPGQGTAVTGTIPLAG